MLLAASINLRLRAAFARRSAIEHEHVADAAALALARDDEAPLAQQPDILDGVAVQRSRAGGLGCPDPCGAFAWLLSQLCARLPGGVLSGCKKLTNATRMTQSGRQVAFRAVAAPGDYSYHVCAVVAGDLFGARAAQTGGYPLCRRCSLILAYGAGRERHGGAAP
jgi:hypothetical protein